MKLILDKNFIQEKETIEKEIIKTAVRYDGRTKDGETIELYDVEAGKIAPIVRFLIEGKKSKVSLFLIIGIGLLLVLFFALMAFLLWPKKEIEVVAPVIPKSDPVIKTEIIEKENPGFNFDLEVLNEIDTMRWQKNQAEIETERLLYKMELKTFENEKLIAENEKLIADLKEITELYEKTEKRNINSPADEFIYYLGDLTYQRCKRPTEEQMLRKCENIYYNFLEYEKKTWTYWNF